MLSFMLMQAILRSRLESLWHLLLALPPGPSASGAEVSEDLDSDFRWENLENLASIPCQSGMLVRIKYRQTVIVLPPDAEDICRRIELTPEIDPALPYQMMHAPASKWTIAMLRVSLDVPRMKLSDLLIGSPLLLTCCKHAGWCHDCEPPSLLLAFYMRCTVVCVHTFAGDPAQPAFGA